MEYSYIVKWSPEADLVGVLSLRGGGEALPGGSVPVAVRAFDSLTGNPFSEQWVVLGWSSFSNDNIKYLLDTETKFSGCQYSVIFERTIEPEELANDRRFISTLNRMGYNLKPGNTDGLRKVLGIITRDGKEKVYLAWKGEIVPLDRPTW